MPKRSEKFPYSLRTIQTLVRKHKPRGWKVRFNGHGLSPKLDGLCVHEQETILCRQIGSVYALYVFLHECGHAWHDTEDGPSHVMEYAAERYAIYSLMAEGIPVSREILRGAKANVAEHIARDQIAGRRILRAIERWVNE